MGTAAYMSPEQACDQHVDKRTDVWALGCVWFELLVGGRAFRGNSSAEILAAVLREEPDWSQLPANLPPRLRGLLTRCLAKPWHERLADVSTVRFVLDELDAERAAHPAPDHSDAGLPVMGNVPNRRAWLVPGLAVALAALFGLAGLDVEHVEPRQCAWRRLDYGAEHDRATAGRGRHIDRPRWRSRLTARSSSTRRVPRAAFSS